MRATWGSELAPAGGWRGWVNYGGVVTRYGPDSQETVGFPTQAEALHAARLAWRRIGGRWKRKTKRATEKLARAGVKLNPKIADSTAIQDKIRSIRYIAQDAREAWGNAMRSGDARGEAKYRAQFNAAEGKLRSLESLMRESQDPYATWGKTFNLFDRYGVQSGLHDDEHARRSVAARRAKHDMGRMISKLVSTRSAPKARRNPSVKDRSWIRFGDDYGWVDGSTGDGRWLVWLFGREGSYVPGGRPITVRSVFMDDAVVQARGISNADVPRSVRQKWLDPKTWGLPGSMTPRNNPGLRSIETKSASANRPESYITGYYLVHGSKVLGKVRAVAFDDAAFEAFRRGWLNRYVGEKVLVVGHSTVTAIVLNDRGSVHQLRASPEQAETARAAVARLQARR